MANYLLLGVRLQPQLGYATCKVRNEIAMRLEGDQTLSELLNKHDGFESALEAVQNDFATSRNANHAAQQLTTFQAAIAATFNDMNKALSGEQFEFHNEVDGSVGLYLTKFDAIFTLNQDLLLERHYLHPHQGILARALAANYQAPDSGMEEIPDGTYYGDERALSV